MHSFLAFLVLIGVLIFVHELGHFMWAKILGVKVLTFSLGFPPKLFGFRWGETEYTISALPLGGYVKMLGEEVGDDIPEEDRKRALNNQPIWKRLVIIVAGPIMNLLLPLLLYFLVILTVSELRPATVGTLIPGDPADLTGLEPGDRIVEIDGVAIHGFEDLRDVVGDRAGKSIPIAWIRSGNRMEGSIVPAKATENILPVLGLGRQVGRIGVYPTYAQPLVQVTDPQGVAARAGIRSRDLVTTLDGKPIKRWMDLENALSTTGAGSVNVTWLRPVSVSEPLAEIHTWEPGKGTLEFPAGPETRLAALGAESTECFVAWVVEGSPAHAAGLREGDKILAINGREVKIWDQIGSTLRGFPDDLHVVSFRKPDGRVFISTLRQTKVTSTDEMGQEQSRYGFGAFSFGLVTEDDWVPNPNRVMRALRGASQGTWYDIKITGILFAKLFQGRVSLRTLGGPMMIFDIAGRSAKEGATTFLDTMALISVNLGLLNLLPIPILDGGVALLILIEAVRRKRLPDRFRAVYQYIGMGIIGLLVVLVFYNDITRYFF